DEGRRLVSAGRTAEACEKFEAAKHLAPSLAGIALNLADCWERVGRTASAWRTFRSVKNVLDSKRAAYAEERARALEPALTWLTIRFDPSSQGEDAVIHVDGVEVGPGEERPVDRGLHSVEVAWRAGGRWSSTAHAEAPGRLDVVVPPNPPEKMPEPIVLPRDNKDEGGPGARERLTVGLAVGGGVALAASAALVLIAKAQYD